MVVDVPRHEHAGQVRRGAELLRGLWKHVPVGVQIELAAEHLGRGRVADRDEQPLDPQHLGRARLHVPDADTVDLLVSADLLDSVVPDHLDIRRLEHPVLHDLARAECVPAVDERHGLAEFREVQRIFHRGVPASDGRDIEALEKKPVTNRARAHALPLQPLLAREPEPLRIRTGRHDNGTGFVEVVVHPHLQRVVLEVHLRRVVVHELRVEPLRLLPPELHELRAENPVREAGVVLDVARDHELASRDLARDYQGPQVRAGRVDGGGDDDVVWGHGPPAQPGGVI